MSYNKLKSLVANVEAIETAMKIQVQGRQATAEEKEILSRYSGFGGIKEVLNIGTDKPIGGDMQEPIQRLQELINAYPHFTEPMRHNVIEGIKASVLTAFYTPKFLVDAVVRQIHATFSENGLKMRSFLEPSAGIGGFLPIAMSGTYDYAIEKDLISGMILSLLHENTLTRTAAFETIGEQGFDFLNRRAFENWTTRTEADLRGQVVKFLDSVMGPNKLIERFKVMKIEQDPNQKDRVLLDIHITPYFPAKSFVIQLAGHKGDNPEDAIWESEYHQE